MGSPKAYFYLCVLWLFLGSFFVVFLFVLWLLITPHKFAVC